MQKRRYEILLPLRYNDGRMVEGEAFEKTREELIAEFAAVSLMPESVRGIWIRDGTRYEDELLRFVVDVEDTTEHREFFAKWKVSLLERFQQLEIYITSQAIDVI